MKRKWPKTPHDVYCFLNHAALHCKFGSEPDNTTREPEHADIDAANILYKLRAQVAIETYENRNK